MPNKKVNAGALAGALSIVLIWAINQYSGTALPGEVASGVTTIVTFITSYVVREE